MQSVKASGEQFGNFLVLARVYPDMRLASIFLCAVLPGAGQTGLTVYNQHFAVVRDTIRLDLRAGDNRVSYDGATAMLEPGSVVLRDRTGRTQLSIREQSYQSSPVSLASQLKDHEGQQIDFLVREAGQASRIAPGRLIRAGTPPLQPIVEWQGRLLFELPGTPLFPPLAPGARTRPVLEWTVASVAAASVDAELSYVTGGLNWEADYNFVTPEAGSTIDVTGWVTVRNGSGRSFPKSRLKLMAGEVNKLLPPGQAAMFRMGGAIGGLAGGMPGAPPAVQEKNFDEYHLYTASQEVALADGESKQIEFLRAAGVPARIVYVYEGAKLDAMRMRQYPMEMLRQEPSLGIESNPRVWAMREFENNTASRLGMPLPAGRLRFYRRDSGGEPEFVGEDSIRHTPRNETVRVFTGAAFDLVGERRRVNFTVDHARAQAEESFEIKVRNRKAEAVEVVVLERLYRWSSWELFANTAPFRKTDSQTVEFRLRVEPNQEGTLSYSVRYRW
jgi:hypothetical protein